MVSTDQQSLSGAMVGSSDDLLTEILVRLPVASVLRFKSVSKHWHLLLSHRQFTHRYDKQFSNSPGIFAHNIYVPFHVNDRSPPPFTSTDSRLNSTACSDRIGQSCNGLLSCSSHWGNNGRLEYYVFNPTTKQLSFILPVPGGQVGNRRMALAFHQTDCVHYKVVCILVLDPREDRFQVQIYSSETREWKISIESFSAHKLVFRDPVYWNGAVHWAPFHDKQLYFKIDDETLQTLPFPEGVMCSEVWTMYFGEFRGHLHLILHTKKPLFEMLRDHKGWFVKYQVELDELPDAYPWMFDYESRFNSKVIDLVRGREEEDTFMVLKVGEKIIKYNLVDKSFNQIFTLPSDFHEDVPCFHRYIETLTSL
ncbi:F-box protein At5g07610-like [Bidens hawaiensis]|uniref:F-box protein At5g07610-like n=1 Tax=Bidens hawaiensis TaxID=980011 RepID=UPI00404B0A78